MKDFFDWCGNRRFQKFVMKEIKKIKDRLENLETKNKAEKDRLIEIDFLGLKAKIVNYTTNIFITIIAMVVMFYIIKSYF